MELKRQGGSLALCCWLEKEKKMGNGVQAEWGSGCFGTEFCFQGREQRLEQIRGKGGGCVMVCWLLRGRSWVG
jgi:hypothetical protein